MLGEEGGQKNLGIDTQKYKYTESSSATRTWRDGGRGTRRSIAQCRDCHQAHDANCELSTRVQESGHF